MHQLLLLRHAKSSWDDPRTDDRERPLAARGRQAAAALRQVMLDAGLAPDLVLVSTARRTRETAEALEPWAETPLIELLDELYLAERDELLRILNGVAITVRSVLVVGHNPGLHALALTLAGSQAENQADEDMRRLARGFPTGALAEFAVATSWAKLAPGGGRLQRFLVPGVPSASTA
jgi:phosphohistidine phosphatase